MVKVIRSRVRFGMAGVERSCEFRSVWIRIVTVSIGRIGMALLVPVSRCKVALVLEWQEGIVEDGRVEVA